MVEKNPKELIKHARLLGTSEYDGIVFFKDISDLKACLDYSYKSPQKFDKRLRD